MRSRLRAIFLAGVGLLIVVVPVFAHHGNSGLDPTKKVTLKGTVTEWVWANPHCWLKFDVKDDQGNVVHWVAEENAPSTLVNFGFTRQTFKPGDEVAVTMIVAKNGAASGRANQVVLNGKAYAVIEGQ
jgi:uncharacterized protein DUF6152